VSGNHILSDIQRNTLSEVVTKFPTFAVSGLGKTTLIFHEIDVSDAKPVKQRHFPVSSAVEELLNAVVDRMLEMGVIEEFQSA